MHVAGGGAISLQGEQSEDSQTPASTPPSPDQARNSHDGSSKSNSTSASPVPEESGTRAEAVAVDISGAAADLSNAAQAAAPDEVAVVAPTRGEDVRTRHRPLSADRTRHIRSQWLAQSTSQSSSSSRLSVLGCSHGRFHLQWNIQEATNPNDWIALCYVGE